MTEIRTELRYDYTTDYLIIKDNIKIANGYNKIWTIAKRIRTKEVTGEWNISIFANHYERKEEAIDNVLERLEHDNINYIIKERRK